MRRACVVGATGYVGGELCGLLRRHPQLELATAMSSRPGPFEEPVEEAVEEAVEGAIEGACAGDVQPLDPTRFADHDAVFLCTPHGAAAPLARAALEGGARVVDLSADFRLRDPATYEATYGAPHPAPDLLDGAVYGLTERARPDLDGARLVANPGCYPTAVLLPLLPLLEADLLDPTAPLVADAKSGVSGAGKAATETTHFGNVHENFRAYGVGTHRHTAEIHERAETDRVVFVPHLLPCFRGILATLYLVPRRGVDARTVGATLTRAYADEAFVEVLPTGTPALAHVRHTNRCALGTADAGGLVVVVSVLDNLLKGAAGQALQNMNRMLGLEEGLGLP